jgi:hypothetical protein
LGRVAIAYLNVKNAARAKLSKIENWRLHLTVESKNLC